MYQLTHITGMDTGGVRKGDRLLFSKEERGTGYFTGAIEGIRIFGGLMIFEK